MSANTWALTLILHRTQRVADEAINRALDCSLTSHRGAPWSTPHVTCVARHAQNAKPTSRCRTVAPWRTTMRRVFHPETNGVKASPHRLKWMLSRGALAAPSDPWNFDASDVPPRQNGVRRNVTKAECPDWKRAHAPSTAHISPFTARCLVVGRHRRPRGKRPGRASGGRPAALHVTDDTARHLRYTSRAKREADVSLSHRCTMEHHDATGVSPTCWRSFVRPTACCSGCGSPWAPSWQAPRAYKRRKASSV